MEEAAAVDMEEEAVWVAGPVWVAGLVTAGEGPAMAEWGDGLEAE